MSTNAGSCEPVPIQAADFVSVPTLFNRWAMEAGAVDLAVIPRTVLQAINQKAGAELYLLHGSAAVPVVVQEQAWRQGLELLDTDDEVPLRFPSSARASVLAAMHRAYVVDGSGPGEYLQVGRYLFRLGAVGVHRALAESLLDAARAAPSSSSAVAAGPVPASASAPGQQRAKAHVLALVNCATTEQPLRPVEVLPAGGAWPHKRGTSWTDAEREAMFKMRHLSKMVGVEIAGIVGCRRQCIDEQIGPAKRTNGWETRAAKSGWQPSAALLQECGFPLQPLQGLALVAGAR